MAEETGISERVCVCVCMSLALCTASADNSSCQPILWNFIKTTRYISIVSAQAMLHGAYTDENHDLSIIIWYY